ncbi:MAG: tetratricopeptide repeat protein [Deltaproteobacteria bacterium]|nr:tetratricopeptide repeat protein [Deltaproteobacteria bacterium]
MSNGRDVLARAARRHRAGDLQGARSILEAALAKHPRDAGVRALLGSLCAQAGAFEEASQHLGASLEIRPGNSDALNNLGGVLQRLGRTDEALKAYQQAVERRPSLAEAHSNLGNLLIETERPDEAIPHLHKALSLRPDFPEAHYNLGTALTRVGRFAEGITHLRRALALRPSYVEAHTNLGSALTATDRFEEALGCWERALALRPEHPEAHWNRSLALLAAERFREGWVEYEWGFASKDREQRCFPQPRWHGQPLEGKTVLVLAEQGVGDEIMFASCVPDLTVRGARVILECDRRLAPLFARSFPGVRVCGAQRSESPAWLLDPETADYHVSLASLPAQFRNDAVDFPTRASFLVPDPERVNLWKTRLSSLGPGVKVGVSWRGGARADTRRRRTIALSDWAPLLATPNVHFVNLQYGSTAEELAAAKRELGIVVHDWEDADPLTDLEGFAAQISCLDLVISIDNSTVHMAGALGVPVWVLLPRPPDWRWLLKGDTSHWYESVRLFRQREPGQWDDVVERVRTELAQRAALGNEEPAGGGRPTAHGAIERRCTGGGPKAVLVNDTSAWYHWGCTLTSSALRSGLEQAGFTVSSLPIDEIYELREIPASLDRFDDPAHFQRFAAANRGPFRLLQEADLAFVNGEGTLHGKGGPAVALLYLAYAAKRFLDKSIQIVNHSCYPSEEPGRPDPVAEALYAKVYRSLDFIAVREPLSEARARTLGVQPTLSFDCLPLYLEERYPRRPPRDPRALVVGGSVAWRDEGVRALARFIGKAAAAGFKVQVLVGARARPAKDDQAFVEALRREGVPGWELVVAASEAQWLDTLAGAGLLVSGRFHHSIAAAFLGTPFVAFESNTPKMAALCQCLGVEPPLAYTGKGLEQALWARCQRSLEDRAGAPQVSEGTLAGLRNRSRRNFDAARELAARFEAAKTYAQGRTTPDPPTSAAAILAAASALRAEGRLADAEAVLRRGLSSLSDTADLLLGLGEVLTELGRDSEAFDVLQRAAAGGAAQGPSLLLMAGLLLRNRRFEEAAEFAEAAAAADPANAAAALLVIGDSLDARGAVPAALAAYREALSRAPGHPAISARIEAAEKSSATAQVAQDSVDTKTRELSHS